MLGSAFVSSVLIAIGVTVVATQPHELAGSLTPALPALPWSELDITDAPSDLSADEACGAERELVLPAGEAPALECDQARRIITQARSMLATPASEVDRGRFAEATSDWLDPHGLWSVAPDAPVRDVLKSVGSALLDEIEKPPGSGECKAALAVGDSLAVWVDSIRAELLDARALGRAQTLNPKKRWEVASSTPYEDGSVTRRAHDLARLLGHGMGTLEHGYGPDITKLSDATVARTAPDKSRDDWSKVVLAAAVRAYIPQLDPHGAWAPLDEETSIYDLDLEIDPPPRLWSEMTRTTIGVRIDDGARPPLKNGDVVLKVGSVAVGGLSVEQANQLAVLPVPEPTPVILLRPGSTRITQVEVGPELELLSPPPPATDLVGLETREVPYGRGYVVVVKIHDVPDDLGERLTSAIFDRPRDDRPLGVLLDLRGNGGGSTDGALAALGIFLPGAALFPMKRRGGEIEIDRAPKPREENLWDGPVAALVDGDSASAAEMLAGAIASYQRGIVVGSRTYGKGCAQEYLDDEVGVGVLRLTTLVFSLPDGSPLQRIGVSPHIALGLPATGEAEENLQHAPSTWRGPDVRDKDLIKKIPWPSNEGRVGQCDDETTLRALRALGTTRAASR